MLYLYALKFPYISQSVLIYAQTPLLLPFPIHGRAVRRVLLWFSAWALAWAGYIRSIWLPSDFCFLFLPLDLWATPKGQLCDTYFIESRVKGWSGDPAKPFW